MTNTAPNKTRAMFLILSVASFVSSMSITITAVMLPSIMQAYQIPAGDAQWLTSGATLVSGIAIPIAAYLMKIMPSRRYFILAMSAFTLGTLISAIATNYPVLLVGRLIQAVGTGLIMPFTQVILLAIYPKSKHGTVMGIFSMTASLAPIIAPTFAGLIIDHYGFQGIFLILFIVSMLILLPGIFLMRNVTETYKERFPLAPVVLSSLGFCGLLIGLGNVSTNPFFSLQCGGLLLVGLLCLGVFVQRQLRASEPFLNLRVFQNTRFRIAVIVSLLVSLAVMGSATFMPVFAQSIQGHSATTYALATLPGAIGMTFSTLFSGKLYDLKGPKILLLCGAILLPIGSIMGAFFQQDTGLVYLGAVSFFHAFTSGVLTTAASIMGLSNLEGRDRIDGSSILNTIRQMALAVASTASIVIYSLVQSSSGDMPGVQAVYASFSVYGVLTLVFVLMFFRVSKGKASEHS